MQTLEASPQTALRQLRAPALGWVIARVLTALSYVAARLLSGHVNMPNGRTHLDEGLLTWDAGIYRLIADNGYLNSADDVIRFFPLYPLSGRWLSAIPGISTAASLVIITNLFALLSGWICWRVVWEWKRDADLADRATIFLAIWPAGISLVLAYSEGMFLALSLATLWLLANKRPLLAAPLLLLAGLSRPTGILLCAPLGIIALRELRLAWAKPGWIRQVVEWAAAGVAPLVGMASYLLWVEDQTGDAGAVVEFQRQFRGGFREPVSKLVTDMVDITGGDMSQIYNTTFALGLVLMIVVSFRRGLPLEWTIYLIVGLAVSLAAENTNSIGRYALVLAPAWTIALAELGRNRKLNWAMMAASSFCFVWFGAAVFLGQLIP